MAARAVVERLSRALGGIPHRIRVARCDTTFTEGPRARFDYTVTIYFASPVSARGGKGRDRGGAL